VSAEIDAALELVFQAMADHPEKNNLNLHADLQAGRRPRGCPVSLGRIQHWSETPRVGKRQAAAPVSPEENLLNSLRGIPGALETNNNFTPALGTGCGVPSVASAFGVIPDENPCNPGGVVAYLPLETFDDFAPPDLTAGCWPRVQEAIEFYKASTPPEIKISYPDMQGPINIAHSILGTPLFLAMRLERERLHHLLQMITDFFILARQAMAGWIGPERMMPGLVHTSRICECSVDLISREDYREFGRPYDLQIAAAAGGIVAIHMDGGRHVFEETLRWLPVGYTEWMDTVAGFAPQISQDDALAEIGEREIILSGGIELWGGDFEAKIIAKLERLEDHPLQMFGFTGMTCTPQDQPALVALRGRLDDWYAERWG
jgi:hypothetical protein